MISNMISPEGVSPHEGINPEQKDFVPTSSIHIELIRHGESRYEAFKGEMRGEDTRNYAPDLTEIGISTMKNVGDALAEKIDSQNDDVYILTSPEIRAVGSAKIIEEKLRENGLDVVRNDPFKKLGEATVKGDRKELLKLVPLSYLEKYPIPEETKSESIEARKKIANPNLDYAETWRNYAGKDEFKKIEAPHQVSERLRNLFRVAERVKKNIDAKNIQKRQFVIVVSHNMIADPLIEGLFGEGLKRGRSAGLQNGETISCDFHKENDTITITFRGQQKTITPAEFEQVIEQYE